MIVLMRIRIAKALTFFFLLSPILAEARPVSYEDGWMLMQMNDSMENSASFSYSPTAKDAFGIRSDYMRDDETWLNTLTYNRLIQRWNNPGSQVNIFFMTGAGLGDDHGDLSPAGFVGAEADWESRRYYVSYETRFIGSSENTQYFDQKGRIGVAPYIGGYDAIHTWLMLQVQNNPSADDKFIVTPLVRLFNTEFLTEVGYSSNKTMLLNATWQF